MMSWSKNSPWSKGLRYKLACAYNIDSNVSVCVYAQSDQCLSFRPEETLDSCLPKEPILKTDQTAQMHRLIWVFDGRTCQLIVFARHQLKCFVVCFKHKSILASYKVMLQSFMNIIGVQTGWILIRPHILSVWLGFKLLAKVTSGQKNLTLARKALTEWIFKAHLCKAVKMKFRSTVKPVFSSHSKMDKTKILMTNGSLMKVESIAECSPWSILQYFWPASSDNRSWIPISGLLFEWPLKTGFTVHWKFIKVIMRKIRSLIFLHANNKDADRPVHAQSGQHLCQLVSGKYNSLICNVQNFNILASYVAEQTWSSLYSWTLKASFSHVAAHM